MAFIIHIPTATKWRYYTSKGWVNPKESADRFPTAKAAQDVINDLIARYAFYQTYDIQVMDEDMLDPNTAWDRAMKGL